MQSFYEVQTTVQDLWSELYNLQIHARRENPNLPRIHDQVDNWISLHCPMLSQLNFKCTDAILMPMYCSPFYVDPHLYVSLTFANEQDFACYLTKRS